MWNLEAFDKKSTLLVRGYRLRGLDLVDLKGLLDVGDSYEIDGIAYPPEAGAYDVPSEVLPRIATYVQETFVVDESCDYQVEFIVEDND